MLIKCPECELQVSDKALSCPHCGYPLKPEVLRARKPRQNKRKRLPNGFGQITELKGQMLRKPFRAMVTVGKTPEGRPICKLLKPEAYFETYNDAYTALLEYNKSPFDLNYAPTLAEVHDKWEKHCLKKRDEIYNGYISGWKYCASMYDIPIREIRPAHIRYCLNDATIIYKGRRFSPTANSKRSIAALLNSLFKYAIDNEYVNENPMDRVHLEESTEVQNEHIAFTKEELNKLWSAIGTIPNVELILIQCYSGWRPKELFTLKTENVNIEEGYMIGGGKTKAGMNRTVPIHSKIKDLVTRYYNYATESGSEYVFYYSTMLKSKEKRTPVNYRKYTVVYNRAIEELGLNLEHRPHDGRKTFATLAKESGMNEYALKRLMGHSIQDLTERVYTDRSIDWLKEEIEKIK